MPPQEVSLTTFMDFMVKSGTPRVTCVHNAVSRYGDEYDPALDYWKQYRDAVVAMHRFRRDKSTLDGVADRVSEHKQENYAKACRTYRRFLGRKTVEWVDPPRATWSASGLAVRIKPELGLFIEGILYAVKLRARAHEPLKSVQAKAMCRLMQTTVEAGGEWRPMVLVCLRAAGTRAPSMMLGSTRCWKGRRPPS